MIVQSLEQCTNCNGEGCVTSDSSIPVYQEGRYKLCDVCGGSGTIVVEHEDTNKNCWIPVITDEL